jgi:ankyrin repeat protein
MASANGFLDVVLLLLQSGAPVNAANKAKNTPLHWAALNGRNDIITLLLEWKADPNIKNEFDRLPIEEALQNGFTEAAEILAKVSTLSDDKIYTSIYEVPEED